MEARLIFALLAFLALAEFAFTEEVIDTDNEGPNEATLSDNFNLQNQESEDLEIPKRAMDSVSDTWSKLGRFFHLAKAPTASPTPKPRKTGWFWRLRRRRSPPPTPIRPPKLDLVFVMDKSGSIGYTDFQKEKEFIANLIEYFEIFPAKTRVAIVTYSTLVNQEFDFKKYINKECLRKGIRDIVYTGGSTATGNALQYVKDSLIFNAAAGARRGAKKVVFVVTDGRSNTGRSPAISARELRDSGVIMFAFGVTNSVRSSELSSIASSSSHVLQVGSYATLDKVTKKIKGDLSKKCTSGRTFFDSCGRRCQCKNGKLVKCCRLRKEFTDMSSTERARYIQSVKTASTSPVYKTAYDKLLTLHKTIFGTSIHRPEHFLPWHRWFILQYENLLRQIDCRVTVPYWDWSLVSGDPWSSSVWNTVSGFGGNGIPAGRCVATGPFRSAVWSLPSSAGGRCLRRRFNSRTPDAIAVANLISVFSNPSNFMDFERLLRVDFHDRVHCYIGGTMCIPDAAAAPEFFLHHAFIDKIWWDWQKQSAGNKFHTHFRNQNDFMTSTPYRSRDFLDLNDQPGCVCAEYINPQNPAFTKIKAFSLSNLQRFARLRLPPFPPAAKKLFGISDSEMKSLSVLRAKIEPKRFVFKTSLGGKDALLGFKLAVRQADSISRLTSDSQAEDEENKEYEPDE